MPTGTGDACDNLGMPYSFVLTIPCLSCLYNEPGVLCNVYFILLVASKSIRIPLL